MSGKAIEIFHHLGRATGGIGLGLAIAARVVALHHGRICVKDSPLCGARFTLHLPHTRPEQSWGFRPHRFRA